MAANVPLVEVAHHRDHLGIGRPDGEADAGDALHLRDVRAQRSVAFEVGALAVKVQLEIGEQRRKAVRIFELGRAAAPQLDAEAVGLALALAVGLELGPALGVGEADALGSIEIE